MNWAGSSALHTVSIRLGSFSHSYIAVIHVSPLVLMGGVVKLVALDRSQLWDRRPFDHTIGSS